MATSLFRRRRFDECVKVCSELLEKNPYDQVTRAGCLLSRVTNDHAPSCGAGSVVHEDQGPD